MRALSLPPPPPKNERDEFLDIHADRRPDQPGRQQPTRSEPVSSLLRVWIYMQVVIRTGEVWPVRCRAGWPLTRRPVTLAARYY